jgi:alpha/beta superfamily hydrolase
MHNKVTVTVARAFEARGALTLRFNFRGVGASAGTHADGIGELEDALAVAAWMRARWPGTPLHIGGFSFGALITAKVAESVGAASLVSIALPVRRLAPFTDGPRCPWLVVHGREDDVVECDEVERWVAACAVRPRLVIIPAAGHYFHGKLRELTDSVGDFLLALDDVTAAEHA